MIDETGNGYFWTFTPGPEAPRRARLAAAERLLIWGVSARTSGQALWVLGGLVTEALAHDYVSIEVTVGVTSTTLTIEVTGVARNGSLATRNAADERVLRQRLQEALGTHHTLRLFPGGRRTIRVELPNQKGVLCRSSRLVDRVVS